MRGVTEVYVLRSPSGLKVCVSVVNTERHTKRHSNLSPSLHFLQTFFEALIPQDLNIFFLLSSEPSRIACFSLMFQDDPHHREQDSPFIISASIENLCFQQVLGWCECPRPRDHTWRTTGLNISRSLGFCLTSLHFLVRDIYVFQVGSLLVSFFSIFISKDAYSTKSYCPRTSNLIKRRPYRKLES